jgi:hypothetical protein
MASDMVDHAGRVAIECADCGEWFGSKTACNKHRVRAFNGDAPLRCLTSDEMEARGMRARFAGLWRDSSANDGES